jgi:hypothetical protein
VTRPVPGRKRIAHQDGDAIHVVDISTGKSANVVDRSTAKWLDDATLIVIP